MPVFCLCSAKLGEILLRQRGSLHPKNTLALHSSFPWARFQLPEQAFRITPFEHRSRPTVMTAAAPSPEPSRASPAPTRRARTPLASMATSRGSELDRDALVECARWLRSCWQGEILNSQYVAGNKRPVRLDCRSDRIAMLGCQSALNQKKEELSSGVGRSIVEPQYLEDPTGGGKFLARWRGRGTRDPRRTRNGFRCLHICAT